MGVSVLVRVSCDRCRLSPLWTDDPAALVRESCGRPGDCAAHVVDEQFTEVKLDHGRECRLRSRLPGFPGTRSRTAATLAESRSAFRLGFFPSVAAVLTSLALASAYENAAIRLVLCELTAPAFFTFLLYQSSPKTVVAPLIALTIAALGIDALGVSALSASPLSAFCLAAAAVAAPVVFDLEFFDLATAFRCDVVDRRRVATTFVVLTALLLAIQFPGASRIARREDEAIIRRLAQRIKTEGSSLVLDRLDPRLARDAERRLRIVASGRSYELARASSQTVVDQRSVATRVDRGGALRSYKEERVRQEHVTLVLPLKGNRAPDEVEIDGVRGPATTFTETVALAK